MNSLVDASSISAAVRRRRFAALPFAAEVAAVLAGTD